MIGFDVPSFMIERGHVVVGEGGIAGHQIQDTDAAIFGFFRVLCDKAT
jgi:hypothetical protein